MALELEEGSVELLLTAMGSLLGSFCSAPRSPMDIVVYLVCPCNRNLWGRLTILIIITKHLLSMCYVGNGTHRLLEQNGGSQDLVSNGDKIYIYSNIRNSC